MWPPSMLCVAAMVASMLPSSPAGAQSFTWGGTTTDYGTATNWSNPGSAPPIGPGQSAVFDTTGTATVNVSAGPIAPDSWTFSAASQSYFISGANVNFSLAGASGGIIDNANAGQSIEILNNIGGSGIRVQLLGNSALTLFGNNTYSGGTTVGAFGTLSVVSNSALGTGTVTLDNGAFQAGAPNLVISNNFKIDNTAAGSAIETSGFTLTISGNITDGNGAGKLNILGSGNGAVILSGTNTYSGGTDICSCGQLQLGTLATTTSIVGSVTNDGIVSVVNANTSGITSITNDGQFAFSGANTAGTATVINKNGGEIFFLDNSSAGSAKISNSNSPILFGFPGGTDSSTAGAATIINKNGGQILFLDNSSAGSANISNRSNGTILFGFPGSTDTSTAANATIDNNDAGIFFSGSSNGGSATIANHHFGGTVFNDQSSAGSATIINNNNNGTTAFGSAGGTDTSTAGNAVIINNSGGETDFNAFSTAGKATITTNSGGETHFFDNSTGGAAQFITNGTGFVDFGDSIGPNSDGRITAGSIAGSGSYYIGGGNTLVVGGNNLSTTVSGVIADNNPCGCTTGSGSLEKIGAGTLILSGPTAIPAPRP